MKREPQAHRYQPPRESWMDRTDVNTILWLLVLFGIVVALCAVPPEWYGPR